MIKKADTFLSLNDNKICQLQIWNQRMLPKVWVLPHTSSQGKFSIFIKSMEENCQVSWKKDSTAQIEIFMWIKMEDLWGPRWVLQLGDTRMTCWLETSKRYRRGRDLTSIEMKFVTRCFSSRKDASFSDVHAYVILMIWYDI